MHFYTPSASCEVAALTIKGTDIEISDNNTLTIGNLTTEAGVDSNNIIFDITDVLARGIVNINGTVTIGNDAAVIITEPDNNTDVYLINFGADAVIPTLVAFFTVSGSECGCLTDPNGVRLTNYPFIVSYGSGTTAPFFN